MAECDARKSCFFYTGMGHGPPSPGEQLRDAYCHGNYTACARLLIHRVHGPYKVPRDLSPDDIQEACKILDDLS